MKRKRTLKDLQPGQQGKVLRIQGEGKIRRRLADMGLTPGVQVYVRKKAPFGDPIELNLRGYSLSIRKEDAGEIEIE